MCSSAMCWLTASNIRCVRGAYSKAPKKVTKVRKVFVGLIAAFAAVAFGIQSFEQQGPVETVREGRKAKLEGFCKNFIPGQQRSVACLKPQTNKLSAECKYAVYDAAVQLKPAVSRL